MRGEFKQEESVLETRSSLRFRGYMFLYPGGCVAKSSREQSRERERQTEIEREEEREREREEERERESGEKETEKERERERERDTEWVSNFTKIDKRGFEVCLKLRS